MMKTKTIQSLVCAVVTLVVSLSSGTTAVWSSERQDDVPWDLIYRHTAKSFVVVNYHLKKSDRPLGKGEGGYASEQRTIFQRILSKSTLDTIGVIISDKGAVFTPEIQPQLADVVAKITVTGADGVVLPAWADRVLVKAPGKVLRIEGELPVGWRALEFAELAEVNPDTKLYAATMKIDEQNHMYIGACRYGLDWNDTNPRGHYLQLPNLQHVGVICNAEGRPTGVTVRKEIYLGPTGPSWRGKDVLADAGISVDQQKQLEDTLKKDFARNVYEIVITFRPKPKEEEMYDFGGRYPFAGLPFDRGSSQERLMFGLGFAEDKLLVPWVLPREQVAGIDTISIKTDDTEIPARFGGVLKQCDAMVIELEEGKLPRTVAFAADGRLTRTEPFWAVFVRELGGKDVLVEHTRWIEKRRGYADRWYPVVVRPIQLGSWLLNRQGKLVGFFGKARHELDRLEPYLLGGRYSRFDDMIYYPSERTYGESYFYRDQRRLFEATELARILADLPANYDEHIRHLTKDEQKRRVWLGVEYTRLSKEIVKQMNLRDQTEDGHIGLVINRVYAGSPASQLGLTEGDVLLEIAVDGAPWPIELVPEDQEDFELPDFDEEDIPKEFEAMGLGMPRMCPWPSRDNYLTRMLGDIGAGAPVKLSYIHAGESMEKEFVIEQAPRDMLSAAKYKNETLGLTVKDLTYEMRSALRLGDDEAAVVVAQIEQGKPAALARIKRYELIRAVDGVQVDGVENFEKLIKDAQQANKASVRLTVEWMGKTRLADLKFEAEGASGMLKSLIPGL